MKIKKRTFTLLEILIGLGLTIMVMTTLTWCYKTMSQMNQKADQERNVTFRLSYLQNRLAHVLPAADDDFFFLTPLNGNPSLIFPFNNGTNLDKKFAGKVIGRIYLDTEGNLSLGIISKEHQIMRREILYEEVEKIEFRFFNGETLKWQNEWLRHLKTLPAIVDIHLIFKDKTERHYTFPLPQAKETITL